MDVDDELAALMRDAGSRLLGTAYQLTHDRSAAQDLVQEALMHVLSSWRRRRPDVVHAEAYLRRAVLNEFLKTRRRASASEVITNERVDSAAGQFENELVERDRVWRALEQLPPRQRAVLVLRYFQDLSDVEIADAVGCRRATVRSLAARGLSTMRPLTITSEVS